MNNIELIKEKIDFIQSELWYAKSAEEVIELYTEYLKLDVMIHGRIPSFTSEVRDGNCYTYAMNFYYSDDFKNAYHRFGSSSMDFNTGFIGNRENMFTTSLNGVIDNFYKDCEALNIATYDLSLSDIPSHGGYKILFYVKSYPTYCDFHFVRQNLGGEWSHKDGRFGKIEITDTPYTCDDYKLVRTLEIVKPTIM